MSSIELATAYVNLIPSMGGAEKRITADLVGVVSPAGDAAGRSVGARMVSSLGESLASAGDRLVGFAGTWLKRGLLGGVAATTGVAAVGLSRGLKRALDREDAIITFRRMGLADENIAQLTDQIDRSLSGTVVSNPQGFALAGRFLAQGFDEADIPGIVSTIADMASVGNRSFEEMADVMVAAAGAGRVTAVELQRMGDIPLGKVAAELGVTEGELRKMVSAGEVTAETFLDAFASIEEFSDAAKDPTTRTAWMNLWTAVGSAGEKFLAPFLGEGGWAQQGLLDLRGLVDSMGPTIQRWGQAFADWLIPAVENTVAWIRDELLPMLQQGRQWISDNEETIRRYAEAVVPAAAGIAALATSISLVTKAWQVLKAATPLGLLLLAASAVMYLWQNSETFRAVVTNAFEAVRAVVEAVIGAVVGWFQNLGSEQSAIGEHLSAIWGQIKEMFSIVFDAIGQNVERFVSFVTGIWDRWGGTITRLVTGVWDIIKGVIEGALRIIRGLFEVILGLLTGDWERAWNGVKDTVMGIWDTIVDVVTTAVTTVVSTVTDILGGLWDSVKEIGSNLVRGLWDGIKSMARWLVDKLTGWVKDVIPGPIKNVLGISSPSKLAMGFGTDIGDGLAIGLRRSMSDVGRAAGELAAAASMSLTADSTIGSFGMPEQGPSTVVLVDEHGDFLARLRSEAGKVMTGSISPLSVGRAAWGGA